MGKKYIKKIINIISLNNILPDPSTVVPDVHRKNYITFRSSSIFFPDLRIIPIRSSKQNILRPTRQEKNYSLILILDFYYSTEITDITKQTYIFQCSILLVLFIFPENIIKKC